MEEVREEESRLSAEFSLIGEFIHKWQILEKPLLSKYHLANLNSSDRPDRWVAPGQVCEKLYRQNLLDKKLLAEIRELNNLRNAFVHDRNITVVRTEAEIKESIAKLDEVITLVSQILVDDMG